MPDLSLRRLLDHLRSLPHEIREGFRDRDTRRRWLRQAGIAFAVFFAFLLVLFIMTWFGLLGDIPTRRELMAIRQPEASKIYSADGRILGKYYTKNRNTLKHDEIPQDFMAALVATEDERFWKHTGIDVRSWIRVLVKGFILRQEGAGGGSTLSQQLAKNLFPRKKYWLASMLINKYREWIIAIKLERVYAKDDLLTFYINTVPFGEDIFGLDAAADRFFSKTADELTMEECALLVGLLKATGYYNPKRFPDRAIGRRNIVLRQMMVNGVIDSLTLDSVRQIPLTLSYARNTDSEGIALYFRNHLRPILLDWCANHTKPNGEHYNLYTDGLRIHTTIDYGMQEYAEQALKAHMPELQQRFDAQFTSTEKLEDPFWDAVLRSRRYEALMAAGLDDEAIRDSLARPVAMKWWTWQGVRDTVASPLDSVAHMIKMLQGALVAVHPLTGGVLVWVGGDDARHFNIDYALTPRHPGSSFKPVVYATAIDLGVDPCSFYANRRLTYADYENWSPGNSDGVYEGIYSLPGALAKSINTIAAQLIFEAGIDNVIQKARLMGLQGDMKRVPSLALGTAEVTVLEMASAYNTFLNKGMHKPAYFITRIEDQDGRVLEEFKSPAGITVFSPETAGVMTQMMANVVDRGTAAPLRYKEIGVKGAIAGKTGTTQFHSDGWFIGMTPRLVAAAWVGAFDRRISFQTMREGMGSKTAMPFWGDFIRRMQADTAYRQYFSSAWPEEFKWINNCPFEAQENELIELGLQPGEVRDTAYTGGRKFKLPDERRRAIQPVIVRDSIAQQ